MPANKMSNKIYKNIFSLFSLSALVLVFFAMPLTAQIAQAAEKCSYIVNFSSDKNSVSEGGVVIFTSKVTREPIAPNTLSDCESDVEMYLISTSSGLSHGKKVVLFDLNNSLLAQAQFSVPANLIPLQTNGFKVVIRKTNWLNSQLTESSVITIYKTGEGPSQDPTGDIISFTISPSDVGQFQMGESFSLTIDVRQRRISAGISEVDVVVLINGKPVSQTTKNTSELGSPISVSNIVVSSENGFGAGTNNNIEVKLLASGSNSPISSRSGTISVGADPTAGDGGGDPTAGDGGGDPTAGDGGGDPTAGGGNEEPPLSETDKLYNPLPTGNLINMVLIIAKGFLTVTAVIAVAFIMIGGFQMIISRGEEEAQIKAKKTITWAILGVVIASLSFSIVAIVENLLRAGVKTIE